MRRLAAFLLLVLLPLASWAADGDKPVRELSEGPPKYASGPMSMDTYKPIETRRLAKARVLWVNYDLLREMGYQVPPEGMTPAFEKELLDAFAWSVPQKKDAPDAFGPETKTFYADGYGGQYMNGNLGSGRAGSAGQVQIKGIGRTPMVGPTVRRPWKVHGGASMQESIREAVWGEILNKELPHGANRVVCLIDTGTYTHYFGPIKEPRALAVRLDPIRPAHFMPNPSATGEHAEWDKVRVANAIVNLADTLPQPPGSVATQPRERLRLGFTEFVDRIARQYATAYARNFYHGATSPSNMQIDGGAIDYGTQTSISGFQPIKILPDEGPFGQIDIQHRDLIDEMVRSYKDALPDELKDAIPSSEEMRARLHATYDYELPKQMLWLTGAPEATLEPLAHSAEGRRLGSLLVELSKAGNEGVRRVYFFIPRTGNAYDLPLILNALAKASPQTEGNLRQTLAPFISDKDLRDRVAKAYGDFYERLVQIGRGDHVKEGNLRTALIHGAKIRGENRPELFRNNFYFTAYLEVWRKITGTQMDTQHLIDGLIQRNLRTPPEGLRDYDVVLSTISDPARGEQTVEVFDAKTGKNETRTLTPFAYKPAKEASNGGGGDCEGYRKVGRAGRAKNS